VLEETGEEIRKVDFVKEYMAARELVLLLETIMKAWARCGICPLNPNIFTDAEFAPSTSTSTKGHFPASYLAEFYGEESDLEADNEENEPDNDNETDGSDSEHEDQTYSNALSTAPQPPPSNPTRTRSLNPTSTRTRTCVVVHTPMQITSVVPVLPLISRSMQKQPRADIEAENTILRLELKQMRREKEAALMHATMAQVEVDEMAMKLNAKKQKICRVADYGSA
jgi:hypothetical protein